MRPAPSASGRAARTTTGRGATGGATSRGASGSGSGVKSRQRKGGKKHR
jgi:hypothetical protein